MAPAGLAMISGTHTDADRRLRHGMAVNSGQRANAIEAIEDDLDRCRLVRPSATAGDLH